VDGGGEGGREGEEGERGERGGIEGLCTYLTVAALLSPFILTMYTLHMYIKCNTA
jgi:hypothetical protein